MHYQKNDIYFEFHLLPHHIEALSKQGRFHNITALCQQEADLTRHTIKKLIALNTSSLYYCSVHVLQLHYPVGHHWNSFRAWFSTTDALSSCPCGQASFHVTKRLNVTYCPENYCAEVQNTYSTLSLLQLEVLHGPVLRAETSQLNWYHWIKFHTCSKNCNTSFPFHWYDHRSHFLTSSIATSSDFEVPILSRSQLSTT